MPFYDTSGIDYYFETSSGLCKDRQHLYTNGLEYYYNLDNWFVPNFDKGKLLFVPDIVLFHKGVAQFLIEVVHTNTVSTKKIDIMKKAGFWQSLYEIDADEILNIDIASNLEIELPFRQII